jgi:hypothetical protein
MYPDESARETQALGADRPPGVHQGETLNDYEKAFVEHIAKLNIQGAAFTRLVREGLEAEYGGEIGTLLSGLKPTTLESPEKFAAELYRILGSGAMPYYVTIIKFAESGRFSPEQDMEEEREDEELESLVHEIEPDSEQGDASDSQA